MTNPILVELTRGDLVESVHRGAVAVCDAKGASVFALGDVDAAAYPRSSLKPVQALPLVESGAGVSEEEIALACASHSGEPMHTVPIAAWLARIGCSERDLACGPHPPRYEPVWEEMIRRGERPRRIHNNCSGKHTGFLALARHWNIATQGYERVDHPVQQAVKKTLSDLSGLADFPFGIDGCTAPNFALPLPAFARALAKLPEAAAGRRIVRAMTRHPELVSGTGRWCAKLMHATKDVAVKAGAEGVYAAIVPERGLGIALKIDDGAGRAAETAIAAVLAALGLLARDHPLLRTPVTNTRDAIVGERRPGAALL
ncbi:MAG TPA: asparaginase [Rhizomicrobium sp.]|nr:asparaginase [Rhizomicrobium sp.]